MLQPAMRLREHSRGGDSIMNRQRTPRESKRGMLPVAAVMNGIGQNALAVTSGDWAHKEGQARPSCPVA